jgi:ribonuclease R
MRGILTQLVIDTFTGNMSQALNYKQVSAKLNINDDETREIIHEIILDQVHKGLIIEAEKGKYQMKERENLLTGKVDMTQSGSAYLIVEGMDEDIYLAPRKLRNALHGDLVKVFVYAKRNGKNLEGEVLEILERARTEFTGVVQINPRFAFLIPDNKKMQHDIFIPLDKLNGAEDGMKAVARMTEWPDGTKNPFGEIIHVLGVQGAHNTEMNAVLAEYGFPLEFPAKVEQESNAISTEITKEEIKKRRDFRDTLTVTIDPFDAKDFDDAISFKKLPNGRFEVGVHIADVSHYVQPGTALDAEAFERGTSVYLVGKVIPMLPEKLSNELCSLRPHEDKLTFSAVFEMDSEGHVHDQWYGRTVIHSDRRFTYEEVWEILQDENSKGDYAEELRILNGLAYKLRDARFRDGAINFETTEVKFKLDEEGKPIGVYVKERNDAHKLVEDFMLLANRKVAEFIATKGTKRNSLTFVYRVHDTPNEEVLNDFAKFASRFGYKVQTKNHKEISRSLNQLMTDVEGKKEQNVLTQLAIRSMAKAIYSTKKTSHYGLAFDFYTHFTSPIRRYPDVMVHRLLQHYLDNGKSVDQEAYEKMCLHASQMEKRAADAERMFIKYKQAEYLQDNVGQEFTGIISGVTEWGIYVEIIENKCEGMVRLRDIDDDFYVLDPVNYCIIGQRKKRKYQLGDEVKIRVRKVDLSKKQIDFQLITDGGPSGNASSSPARNSGTGASKRSQSRRKKK